MWTEIAGILKLKPEFHTSRGSIYRDNLIIRVRTSSCIKTPKGSTREAEELKPFVEQLIHEVRPEPPRTECHTHTKHTS